MEKILKRKYIQIIIIYYHKKNKINQDNNNTKSSLLLHKIKIKELIKTWIDQFI